jgi:hypothetical protein
MNPQHKISASLSSPARSRSNRRLPQRQWLCRGGIRALLPLCAVLMFVAPGVGSAARFRVAARARAAGFLANEFDGKRGSVPHRSAKCSRCPLIAVYADHADLYMLRAGVPLLRL